MEELEFIKAVRNNDFIKSVIVNNGFSKVNVSQFDYSEEFENDYKFRNFPIGRWVFDSARIRVLTGDLTMKFRTADQTFVDELPFIIGTGPTYQKAILPQEPSMLRTKVGKVDIEGKIAHVSYLIAEPYGAEITILIPGNLT